ncbi:hypothetical protein, partial [Campylobacter concisus]|uniref:hypothetical protein n=1 Tax=Campylobacter concisus TaxID=199 RepID=UPI001CA48C1F
DRHAYQVGEMSARMLEEADTCYKSRVVRDAVWMLVGYVYYLFLRLLGVVVCILSVFLFSWMSALVVGWLAG